MELMIVYRDALSMSLASTPDRIESTGLPGLSRSTNAARFRIAPIKKPSDLLGCDGGRVPPMAYLVTPTGVEPVLPP